MLARSEGAGIKAGDEMPKMQSYGLDKITDKLESIAERTEDALNLSLERSADVAYVLIKSGLEETVGQAENSKSTGELVKSLGVTPIKHDKNGYKNIKVGFADTGKHDYTNASIASMLEYGNSRGQPPRPYMIPAIKKAKKEIKNIVAEIWNEVTE
ncbi:hypothetical protein FACS1894132_09710 [Clostridia bacterium]|nr:hypothetical protein FACS1894132_09710 [Clostridia bacterium]